MRGLLRTINQNSTHLGFSGDYAILEIFILKKPPGTLIPSGKHIHCIAVTLTVYALDKLYCTMQTANFQWLLFLYPKGGTYGKGKIYKD